MQIHQLTSTDAFIAFDFDGVPAYGVTRLARKVLEDGARLLSRSTTYAFATFGLRCCGGSAGINAEGEARDDAVTSFLEEVSELVSSGRWATDPGLGLSEGDLAPIRTADRRPEALWTEHLSAELAATGAVAAAAGFTSLGGARVVLDLCPGEVEPAVRSAGGEVVATTTPGPDRGELLATDCDVLFAGGKAGSIDHELAERLSARLVVPVSPVPVTAKAFAVLTRAGSVLVPDFVSTAAPLLAGFDLEGGDPVERVRKKAEELAGEGTAWMAGVEQAESFLRTWQDELPFGRPLA